MISICIPTHNIPERDFLLNRCLESIRSQSYQDFEIIITDKGLMAANTNRAIKKAKGDLIKILYMDDYFAHKHALRDIVRAFKGNWLITGADNNPYPYYTDDIETGNNKLGSPSALTIRNGLDMYFDENMSWLLDCDFYKRMFEKYGEPVILDGANVNLGVGKHQVTHKMSNEEKLKEHEYLINKK